MTIVFIKKKKINTIIHYKFIGYILFNINYYLRLYIVLKVIAVEQVEDEIEIRTKAEFEKFEKKLQENDDN